MCVSFYVTGTMIYCLRIVLMKYVPAEAVEVVISLDSSGPASIALL